ncbi:poly(U)-specific endoribonuclease-like [Lytechinus variegatus]|uniref:poly(U)-specific endoribonuclease-like n=1 Tax=Lytechinus variegatus TaxID=7654 RepID=UPI001BB18070|nr:poly(U)-specific endoribonuclease-like [Lytechinus variegatus]
MKTLEILALCLLASALGTYADSCSGRCGDNNSNYDCQCNSACVRYQDCCLDYFSRCKGAAGLSESELSSLAQDLWNADVNRLSSSDYDINVQTKITDTGLKQDKSGNNFFDYVKTSNMGGTWDSFEKLLDNYIMKTGETENIVTSEMDNFMNDVMGTEVMKITYALLNKKGYFDNESDFKTYIEGIWFQLYSRSSGPMDSSAFEHTFVGEIKNGAVSGFHNWFQFYLLEKEGKANYYGYVEQANPDLILMQFSVKDGSSTYVKTLSSLMHGVSPEFELALFTTCFVSDPGSACSFQLEGSSVTIQTWDYQDRSLIGSAYFSI